MKPTRQTKIVVAVIGAIIVLGLIASAIFQSGQEQPAVAPDAQRVEAAEAYCQSSGMSKFTSDEFGFSMMMPKQNAPVEADYGTFFSGDLNESVIIGVVAKKLPPSDPGYNNTKIEQVRGELMLSLARNKNNLSNVTSARNIRDRNGHIGTEYSYTLQKGGSSYRAQGYAFQVGHNFYTVLVSMTEARWDKVLADNVLMTFAVN